MTREDFKKALSSFVKENYNAEIDKFVEEKVADPLLLQVLFQLLQSKGIITDDDILDQLTKSIPNFTYS